jgi:hypothetical protein
MKYSGKAEITYHRKDVAVEGREGFFQAYFRAADGAEEAVKDK